VNFFRYERMTTRDFYRILHELQAMQRERRRTEQMAASESAAEAAGEPGPVAIAAAACVPKKPAASDEQAQVSVSLSAGVCELSGSGIGTVSSPQENSAALSEERRLPDAA
jgi:hypothetical protein